MSLNKTCGWCLKINYYYPIYNINMKITFHYCLFFTFILNFLNISNANNKRVRYEIRDISNQQRNIIFNAMDIMKHTSMEEGFNC